MKWPWKHKEELKWLRQEAECNREYSRVRHLEDKGWKVATRCSNGTIYMLPPQRIRKYLSPSPRPAVFKGRIYSLDDADFLQTEFA